MPRPGDVSDHDFVDYVLVRFYVLLTCYVFGYSGAAQELLEGRAR